MAKLVGKSERLIAERLDLLRLPDETQALLAARRVPLACAPRARPDRGARAAARRPDRRLARASARTPPARFPADPGEVVDDVLAAEWQTTTAQPLHPVAYSVGGYHGPILPRGRARDDAARGRARRSSAQHARGGRGGLRGAARDPARVRVRLAGARRREERRERECFALTDEDADAARAFGCLLELPGRERTRRAPLRHRPGVARGSARPEDRRARRAPRRSASSASATRAARAPRRRRRGEGGPPPASASATTRRASSARARNLDLGAALARWQPKLDTDAVKLLGSLVLAPLRQGGGLGAPALRRAADDDEQAGQGDRPLPARRAGREASYHEQALAALMRARTPEAALAVVLRLLVAQRLADTAGLPNADRQGVYEPQELAGSKVLDKLARRVAPPSVKQHLAEQEAERERREQAWRDEQAAQLQSSARSSPQANRSAANAASARSSHPTTPPRSTAASSTPETASSNGAAPTPTSDDEEALTTADTPSAPSTTLDSRRDTDALDP